MTERDNLTKPKRIPVEKIYSQIGRPETWEEKLKAGEAAREKPHYPVIVVQVQRRSVRKPALRRGASQPASRGNARAAKLERSRKASKRTAKAKRKKKSQKKSQKKRMRRS